MAQISTFLKDRLSNSMKDRPLGPEEVRGILGVDGHYFSKKPTHDGKSHLFATDVDGETVYVYKVPVV